MNTTTKGIRTQHPIYQQLSPVWKVARDVAEGERAIHAGGEAYLSKLKDEDIDNYKARLNRTPFFGAFWRTVSGLKGMLFRKAPQVVVPDSAKPYLSDIDKAGTPLDLFVQCLAEELFVVGRVGVLVDHPPKPLVGAETVALSEAAGLRPTMQKYSAETIINWKTARINNATQLVLVVLKESYALASMFDYGHEAEDRYRELTLTPQGYRQRVFVIRDDKDVMVEPEMFPLMNGAVMHFIPFFFFGVDSGAVNPESPPLEDLMNMNLHHYTVSADHEHGCHLSGLATPYIAGYSPSLNEKSIGVGSLAFHCFPDPSARMAYAEVSGDFAALVSNLTAKKAEMAVLGARMLEGGKSAVESGETQRQRVMGEQSQLAGMAQVMSMCVTRALAVFCEWAGSVATDGVSYEINRDFIPAGLGATEITALVSAMQAGAYSKQTLHENLQRAEVISQGVTFEEEQERINSQKLPGNDD